MAGGNSVNVQVGVQISDYSLVMSQVQQLQDKLNALSDHPYNISLKLDKSISDWAKSIQTNVQSVEKSLSGISKAMPKDTGAFDKISGSLTNVEQHIQSTYNMLETLTVAFATQAVKMNTALQDIFEAIPEGQDLSSKAIASIGESVGSLVEQIEHLGSTIDKLKSSMKSGLSGESSGANTTSLVDGLVDDEGLEKLKNYANEVINVYKKLYDTLGKAINSGQISGASLYGKYGSSYTDLVGLFTNPDQRVFNAPKLSDDVDDLLDIIKRYSKGIEEFRNLSLEPKVNDINKGNVFSGAVFDFNSEGIKAAMDNLKSLKKDYQEYVKIRQELTDTSQSTQNGNGTIGQNLVLDAQNLLENINGQLDATRAKLQETFDFSKLNIDASPVITALNTIKTTASEIKTTLDSLGPALREAAQAAKAMEKQSSNAGASKQDNAISKKVESNWNKVQAALAEDKFATTLNGLQRRFDVLSESTHPSMQKINDDLRELNNLQDQMSKSDDKTETSKQYEEWSTALSRVKNNLKDVEDAERRAAQEAKKAAKEQKEAAKEESRLYEAQRFDNKAQEWLKSNTQYAQKYGDEINRITKEMYEAAEAGDTDKMSRLNQEFKDITSSAEEAAKSTKSLGTALKEALGGTMLGSIAKAGLAYAIRELRMVVKEFISDAVQIESALAQLSVVTGADGAELDQFFNSAADGARRFGVEVKDMLGSVETFSRLGYDLQQALDLSEAATMLGNVANTSVDAATTGLTSIMKGYGLDVSEGEHIADVITKIGQSYAISSEEIMDAMTRSASAFNATGTSFEKSVALLAAGNASIQNASTLGTSFKTIAARLTKSSTLIQELGDDYEECAEGVSKYRDEIKALTNVDGSGGFDIMADEAGTQYKDLYDIIVGLASAWNEMDQTSQARVSEIIGGTRGLTVISSVIQNIADATNAYSDAMNAAGVASAANEKVMDTTEKKVEQLKTSFQVLSRDVISSDFTKGIVDFGTKAIEVIDNLVNKFGALPVALGALTGLDIIKNLGKLYCPPGEQSLAA